MAMYNIYQYIFFHYHLCGIDYLCNFLLAGFEILAFPCNQFLGQEPGNNEAIQEVACTMFKAEFPIFDKVIPHKIKSKKWMMFLSNPYMQFYCAN